MATPAPGDAERRTQIERTKTGILLLLIGALISWLPTIGLIGLVCSAIGAILVILGHPAFGPVHRRNVIASILLFVVGGAIAVGGGAIALGLGAAAITTAPNEFELAAVLQDIFTNLVLFAAIGAFVSGLASVFFTYALQERQGQLVLWAAYAATVVVQFATLLVGLPALAVIARSLARTKFTSGGTVDVVAISAAISGAIALVQWFAVIPAVLYALANYFAWTRIKKGAIPGPVTLPA